MWRLLNGEAPYNLRVKVIVVLIGTNDLMYASFKASPRSPGYKSRVDLIVVLCGTDDVRYASLKARPDPPLFFPCRQQ
jgi:hypothetical protein